MIINEGGINGSGEGLVNTNSKEFKYLQRMIKEASMAQSEQQKTENHFLSIRFQMEAYLREETEVIIPAGNFLEQFIEVIQVRKKDFANYIDYEATNLAATLKGRRKINPDMAIKLGRIFNINPALWLHIESKNELKKEIIESKLDYTHYSLQELRKMVS
jgi:plasmid maintenance system antidote protein VapI